MSSPAERALDDLFRVGMAAVVARVIRSGLLPADAIRADLQLAAAALAAQGEPGAPLLVMEPPSQDDADAYRQELGRGVARLAEAVLQVLAVPVPDAPVPAHATVAVADLLGVPIPPFARVLVYRGGDPAAVVTLLAGGWSWRGLLPGETASEVGAADPVELALRRGAAPEDPALILYPTVPG